MGRSVKIAISLPEELLNAAEQERAAQQESRSEFFRHAVQEYLHRRRAQQAVERYIQGYVEQPESQEEIAAAQAVSLAALDLEPWE